MRHNAAYEKSFEFAVEIVREAKRLAGKRQYELASQLLRSGTSIGANLSEAEYAQSDADLLSKLSIALKEAAEARYWLKLLERSGDIADAGSMARQADEIIRMLTAGVKTMKERRNEPK